MRIAICALAAFAMLSGAALGNDAGPPYYAVTGVDCANIPLIDCKREPSFTIAPPPVFSLTISQPIEVFRLGEGGCLRGPLEFFDAKGVSLLKIEAGSYIGGSDCGPVK